MLVKGIGESRQYQQAAENKQQRPSHEISHQYAEENRQQRRPSHDQVSRQREDMSKKEGDHEEEQSGVLGAIGETIMEIAQQTKELVIGPDEPKTKRDYVRDREY